MVWPLRVIPHACWQLMLFEVSLRLKLIQTFLPGYSQKKKFFEANFVLLKVKWPSLSTAVNVNCPRLLRKR